MGRRNNQFRELYDIRPRNGGEVVVRTLAHGFFTLVLLPAGTAIVITGGLLGYASTIVVQNFLGNANEAMWQVPVAVNEGGQAAIRANNILEFISKSAYFIGAITLFMMAGYVFSACDKSGEPSSDCALSHQLGGKLSLYGGTAAAFAGAVLTAAGVYKSCTAPAK